MRETELWRRMTKALGPAYVASWADQVVLADLGGRTVNDAIRAGLDFQRIWRAVWLHLELPDSER